VATESVPSRGGVSALFFLRIPHPDTTRFKRYGAPKARIMTARGKREARRPWLNQRKERLALKGRNKNVPLFRPFRASGSSLAQSRGDALTRLPLAGILRAFGAPFVIMKEKAPGASLEFSQEPLKKAAASHQAAKP